MASQTISAGLSLPSAVGAGSIAHRSLDVLCFVLPCGLALQFSLLGEVFVADVIAVGSLPFLLHLRRRQSMRPLPRLVILLVGIWLFAQVETDLIRGTPLSDLARGWAQILLTLLYLVVIWTLIDGQRRRVIIFTLGACVGLLAAALIQPLALAASEPWKFGYAGPFMLAPRGREYTPDFRGPTRPAHDCLWRRSVAQPYPRLPQHGRRLHPCRSLSSRAARPHLGRRLVATGEPDADRSPATRRVTRHGWLLKGVRERRSVGRTRARGPTEAQAAFLQGTGRDPRGADGRLRRNSRNPGFSSIGLRFGGQGSTVRVDPTQHAGERDRKPGRPG